MCRCCYCSLKTEFPATILVEIPDAAGCLNGAQTKEGSRDPMPWVYQESSLKDAYLGGHVGRVSIRGGPGLQKQRGGDLGFSEQLAPLGLLLLSNRDLLNAQPKGNHIGKSHTI